MGELDNRGAVADGGHEALVPVAERDRRLPLHQPADLVCGVRAHLQGGLGELRQRPVPGVRDVADGEDPVLPGDPEVGPGADAAVGCLRQAPAGGSVRGGYAGCPVTSPSGQGGAVGEDDLAGGDFGDGGAEPDVDAARG